MSTRTIVWSISMKLNLKGLILLVEKNIICIKKFVDSKLFSGNIGTIWMINLKRTRFLKRLKRLNIEIMKVNNQIWNIPGTSCTNGEPGVYKSNRRVYQWISYEGKIIYKAESFSQGKKKLGKFNNCALKVKRYNDLLATVFFLQHHPLVNEEILDYALPKILMKRRETSFDVLSPLEVNLVMKTHPDSVHYYRQKSMLRRILTRKTKLAKII